MFHDYQNTLDVLRDLSNLVTDNDDPGPKTDCGLCVWDGNTGINSRHRDPCSSRAMPRLNVFKPKLEDMLLAYQKMFHLST